MPYEIRKQGDEYCVYKKSGGKTLGCHVSREKAAKQIAAVEISESAAELSEEATALWRKAK